MFKCHSTQVARFRLISLQPFDPLRSNQGQLWEPVRVLWMLRSGPPQVGTPSQNHDILEQASPVARSILKDCCWSLADEDLMHAYWLMFYEATSTLDA